jgi:hypothetical protein
MAPELVQEQPYNHSVDIWSYGIILFELFAGQPPFYTNNLYSLIKMIVRNPVKYPSNMSSEFKSFLKGLLIKEPSKRMSWPEILDHPFLRASNSDLDDEKRIRKKYNRWLRQVGQWNKDFEEFKSSKIDFFTSEIYTFDENGFTGYNSNKPGAKKKGKKGGRDKEKGGKSLDSLSIDNSEKIFASLLKNKDPALNNFLEKFSEMCSKIGQKGEKAGSVKDYEKICVVLSKMYKEAPDLFGAKRKSVLLLVKKIRLFMEKLRDKKYLALRLNCLTVCLLISELKDISRVCINELTFAINTVDKTDVRSCLGMLEVLSILFEKMQENFTESVALIQDLLNKKILHALFSSKKNIVNLEVFKLSKGKAN